MTDRSGSASGPVCVVVDDDPSVCDSLGVLLDTYGFAVLSYPSGSAFLADPRHARVGQLIVDQHMPGMDGLEVVAALRREGITVPTVLITGRLDPGIQQRADRLGILAVLEKPFPIARLVALLDGRGRHDC